MLNEPHKRRKTPKRTSARAAIKLASRSKNDGVLFQPWFLSKSIAQAVLRSIPREYHSRMRWYFEDYGCLACKRTNVLYAGNGFCIYCRQKIRKRLVQSMKRRAKASMPLSMLESQKWYFDRAQTAERLLADLVAHRPILIANLPRIDTPRPRNRSSGRM